MANTQNTSYKDNDWASRYHRILGKSLYYLDVDQTELESGTMNKTLKEYTYENGNPKTVALIDFKYPGKSLSDKYSSIQYQIYSSEHEYKTPLPFYMVITYLSEEYPVKMYYVIPANSVARKGFEFLKFPMLGQWMSVRRFSQFQHWLRNKKWNGEEEILAANLLDINWNSELKLKELPGAEKQYPLPTMDFSWL